METRTLFAIATLGRVEWFADADLTVPGLRGSYIDQSLRDVSAIDDWRTSQAVAGSRVDRTINVTSAGAWGQRAGVGLTGGTDANWDNYSVQWDGFLRVLTGHVNLSTRSIGGSRLFVDADRDGAFDASPSSDELVDNRWGTAVTAAADGPLSIALAPGVYPVRVQYEAGAGANTMQLTSAAAPTVRVAYIVPSNRQPQATAVANLQHGLPVMQAWYADAFERVGMDRRSFLYETEADGVTPLVNTVKVNQTDSALRANLWGNIGSAATAAGVPLYAKNQVWLLVAETTVMAPDGTITGGTALGASNGGSGDGGVALVGANMLPSLSPGALTDDRVYHGITVPELGPYPMEDYAPSP